jgi:hypothetical protein
MTRLRLVTDPLLDVLPTGPPITRQQHPAEKNMDHAMLANAIVRVALGVHGACKFDALEADMVPGINSCAAVPGFGVQSVQRVVNSFQWERATSHLGVLVGVPYKCLQQPKRGIIFILRPSLTGQKIKK